MKVKMIVIILHGILYGWHTGESKNGSRVTELRKMAGDRRERRRGIEAVLTL